ncbi:hypothetical protein GE061_017020 [Apolygus lucorum]|uniref:Centromere protein S n=1 Tax=Apolygus lucorum TaxID=248454 RepID=A0A6A4JWE5_APOLU|nr:hypothetical protein GE061_017020 [Apolygus lucorum]
MSPWIIRDNGRRRDAKILIAELVYKKLEDAAEDIEAFSGHAKRNTINADDIKLLFRKNKKIVDLLKTIEESEEKEKPATKRKRTEPEPSAS